MGQQEWLPPQPSDNSDELTHDDSHSTLSASPPPRLAKAHGRHTKYKVRTIPFLRQLKKMIEDEPDVIKWDHGNIIIPDPKALEKTLPLYYKHNNYASFQRQLNNFGYHRKFAHFVVNNSGQLDTVYHKLGTPMSSDIEDLLSLRPVLERTSDKKREEENRQHQRHEPSIQEAPPVQQQQPQPPPPPPPSQPFSIARPGGLSSRAAPANTPAAYSSHYLSPSSGLVSQAALAPHLALNRGNYYASHPRIEYGPPLDAYASPLCTSPIPPPPPPPPPPLRAPPPPAHYAALPSPHLARQPHLHPALSHDPPHLGAAYAPWLTPRLEYHLPHHPPAMPLSAPHHAPHHAPPRPVDAPASTSSKRPRELLYNDFHPAATPASALASPPVPSQPAPSPHQLPNGSPTPALRRSSLAAASSQALNGHSSNPTKKAKHKSSKQPAVPPVKERAGSVDSNCRDHKTTDNPAPPSRPATADAPTSKSGDRKDVVVAVGALLSLCK